jgi:hypothetical protein
MITNSLFRSALVVTAAMTGLAMTGLTLSGCSTQPAAPVNVESLQVISATVESVDVQKRLVSLRGPQGNAATVEVPAAVRNLAQVKVGDQLMVRYYQSVGAAIKPKGTGTNVTVQDTSGVVAAAGSKPGAAVGTITNTTVVVQSVDKKTHTVMINGMDGRPRAVQVKDPAAQKFAATLKKGDEVDLTYTEALAVSIEEIK